MSIIHELATALAAATLAAATLAAQPALAQPALPAGEPAGAASDEYDEQIADFATRENWAQMQRLALQRALPELGDDTPRYAAATTDRPRDFRARAQGVAATTIIPQTYPGNIYPRPAIDRVPTGRLELDRTSQASVRARAPIAPNHAGPAVMRAPRTVMTPSVTRIQAASLRTPAPLLRQSKFDAGNIDFAAEAFGGEEMGLTRFASDVTIGQVANALNGGDPVVSLLRSTERLGDNIVGGLTGIGDSIIDPRRIPGNALRATEGVITGTFETARWAADTTANTLDTAVRIVTEPGRAEKEAKKAGKTVQNVAKSLCQLIAYLPSNTNRKKGC